MATLFPTRVAFVEKEKNSREGNLTQTKYVQGLYCCLVLQLATLLQLNFRVEGQINPGLKLYTESRSEERERGRERQMNK